MEKTQNRRFGYVGMIAVLLSMIILGSCHSDGKPPSPEVLKTAGLVPIEEPRAVPDIEFLDEYGNVHRLSEYAGKVVLLNFWASWCPPCRAEMPSMSELAKTLEKQDFVMLPVNVQEKQPLVEAFLNEYDIQFPVFYDPDGHAGYEIGVNALPTSLLIDREGLAIAAVTGAVEWNDDELRGALMEWTR